MSGPCKERSCVGFPSLRPPRHQKQGDSWFHVKPPASLHLQPITHLQHVTNVCICVYVCVCALGPLIGMEAACWTNSLTNVSTFPPSPPHPAAKLTFMNWAESEEEDEDEEKVEEEEEEERHGEAGKKTARGARWQAAKPFTLPSDSVYLHLTPWGVVSEDSAMMNRPV